MFTPRAVIASVLSVTASVATLIAVAPSAGAAPAVPTAADIGIGDYYEMFVDDAHRQVFVGGVDGLDVFGFDGVRTATLPGPANAFALHGGVLYVAAVTGVRRIDTATLVEKSPLVTGFVGITDLAWAGNRLWVYDHDDENALSTSLYPVTANGRRGPAVPASLSQGGLRSLTGAVGKPNVLWAWSPVGCQGYRIVVGGGDTATVTAFRDNGLTDCRGFAVAPSGDTVAVSTESRGTVELDGRTLRPDGVVYPDPASVSNGRFIAAFGSPATQRLVAWTATPVFPPPGSAIDVYAFGTVTKLRHLARKYTRDITGSADGRLLFTAQGGGRDIRFTTFHVVQLPAGS